jgi:hypothetical protein
MKTAVRTACVALTMCAGLAADDSPPLTLQIADYLAMPVTGTVDGTGNAGSLARVNFLREEPGGKRFFVNDLYGPLYILDKETKKLTTYLNFNGSGTQGGLFHRFTFAVGFANGFISFQFDPDYASNGRFYTIHLEDVEAAESPNPDNTNFPGVQISGYTPTAPIPTPGDIEREAVVIEWTDANIANATFEGSARELMRVQLNTRIHPMGDLIFNPTARRGDPDWRVLYISCGDGGSGEQRTGIRRNPQRLDTLVGKILRIIPDLAEHADFSTVSGNGRYRIPRDNPFVSVAGARNEIWAYGLRNPHRLSWDVDPANSADNHLLAATIGLHTWESVYIVRKGANYGYSDREGNELLKADNTTTRLPEIDELPVQITDVLTGGTIRPTYPVIEYPHRQGGGDAIAGGFVYRGTLVPQLRGQYIFADVSTGRVWYADYKEMLAADDGNPTTLAGLHEVHLLWNDPTDAPDAGKRSYPSMWPIVVAAYHSRGGTDPDLPGQSTVSGPGRVDMRFAVDGRGELYILSKSDGMIRAVVGATEKQIGF